MLNRNMRVFAAVADTRGGGQGGALAPPIILTETFILKSVCKYESQKEEYSQYEQHQNRVFLVKTNEAILISQNKSYGCVVIG